MVFYLGILCREIYIYTYIQGLGFRVQELNINLSYFIGVMGCVYIYIYILIGFRVQEHNLIYPYNGESNGTENGK